ncbi:MAG: kinase/pyrophosphorylase [Candidatus Eisenbacteria bacterium]|nr:kinase/pyrophosphorylase [Candidatus Eisenbacteria bacterium]
MPEKRAPLDIYVVSDATGTTAEAVARSALVQFGRAPAVVRRFPFVRTEEQIEEIIASAPAGECIVVFTLVTPDLASVLRARSAEKGIPAIDVIGPLLDIFRDKLRHAPSMKPGALRHESEEMYKVTEAIHYTLRHDDGQGLDTLDEADLLILGASRTGKTPTSIFLSCRKLKVANMPIVNGIALPDSVYDLPIPKVGFRMNLDRLLELRAQRVDKLPIAALRGYQGRSNVFEEIEYCEALYKKIPGLRTIDVTNRSIEETSEWIVRNVL